MSHSDVNANHNAFLIHNALSSFTACLNLVVVVVVSVPTPKCVVFLPKSSQVIFLSKPNQDVTQTLVNNAILGNYFQMWINTHFVLQSLFKTVNLGLTQNKLH